MKNGGEILHFYNFYFLYLIGDSIWRSQSADIFLSCISEVRDAGGATILALCWFESSLFPGGGGGGAFDP